MTNIEASLAQSRVQPPVWHSLLVTCRPASAEPAERRDTLITEIEGLPKGVIGFEATGKIAAEDYRDVILPALEQAGTTGDVRFLIVMRSFDGMSGGAVWQDLKVGLEHLRAWKRIALVTDIGWMSHATDLFGWMTPGETKTFALASQDEAVRWLAEGSGA